MQHDKYKSVYILICNPNLTQGLTVLSHTTRILIVLMVPLLQGTDASIARVKF